MSGARWTCRLIVALATLANSQLLADVPPAGKIRITDRQGREFNSLQSAIDAAPEGAVVFLGPGRCDERVKITKPIKLLGAGPDKTVIGPTAADRDQQEETLYARAKAFEARLRSTEAPVEPQNELAELKELSEAINNPIIGIDGVQGVELRSLRITSPGTPRARSGLSNSNAVAVKQGGLRMADCAVVGCYGSGVHAEGGSNLEIDDCLIAACWSSGVSATNRSPGRLQITNSDIRNCYHNNIWTGPNSNPCAIEGCRISGSAWFGIRYGDRRPNIVGNAIFENARSGIYAEGEAGVIKQNLFYKNAVGGASCSYENKCQFEGNLFLDNDGAGIYANGACEPAISRNIFVGSKQGVAYGPIETEKVNLQPLGKFHVTENLFWKIDQPVVRRYPTTKAGQPGDQPIELPPDAGNRVADPQVAIGPQQQVVLEASSPARQFDFTGITAVSLKSRWPLTDEERAMIPDDPTREWSKWKKKPR